MPVIPAIASLTEEMTAIRRDLHAHPELGFEEIRTSGIVADFLEGIGADEVHRGIGKTGVVGVIRGNRPGNRMIGLRADMDALPMEEDSDLPFRSTVPGKFHGCGHDAHTAMLMGAARYLAQTRDFAGTVVLIFQPAEEGLGGARAMLGDGLFDRFPCDEIYGMHNAAGFVPNSVVIKPGKAMAGSDFFDITIQGRGSHGAMPELSRDPIVAGTHLVQAIQSIVSRNVPALKSAVVSVTKFNGGSAYNVVPDKVTMGGTIRFFDDAVGELVSQRLRDLAAGLERMFEVTVNVDIRNVFTVLENDVELADEYARAAADIVGEDLVSEAEVPLMGSEDFADMLRARPGVYCMVGHTGGTPAHTPGFRVDETLLPVGASLYARIAERRLAAA